jgi:exosome complex component MTR3
VRDSSERDLGAHLETALRGVVIGERWPKSACEVVITVLEGEEDGWLGAKQGAIAAGGWGMMSVLAGCITVASAALVDAGIDCVDLVSGGVAALVTEPTSSTKAATLVLDPSPAEHEIVSGCVVGYLQSRDEITEIWVRGDAGSQTEALLEQAVKAATMTRTVLVEAIKEAVELKMGKTHEVANGAPKEAKGKGRDVVMTG